MDQRKSTTANVTKFDSENWYDVEKEKPRNFSSRSTTKKVKKIKRKSNIKRKSKPSEGLRISNSTTEKKQTGPENGETYSYYK